MKTCVITAGPLAPSETFIQAVLERLRGNVVHLELGPAGFIAENKPIDEYCNRRAAWGSRLLNILPRFIEFRVRRKWFREFQQLDFLVDYLSSQKFDVILAEYGPTGVAVLDAAKRSNTPIVTHFHGYDCSTHTVIERYRNSYKNLFDYASRIIVVSKRMYRDLVDLGCPSTKISLIYYSPHPSYFLNEPNCESNSILMVGRLTDQKAPHLSLLAFAKALPRCPGLHLRMVGAGELESVCRDLIKALGLTDHVDMLGVCGRDVILREMSNSLLFLQHSVEGATGDREGTPVAIMEAGAAALPVVATYHAGIPDVVTSGETGILVEEGDVDGMAEAISELFHNRVMASELGCNARKRMQERYTMQRHIEEIEQTLNVAVVNHRQSHLTSPEAMS